VPPGILVRRQNWRSAAGFGSRPSILQGYAALRDARVSFELDEGLDNQSQPFQMRLEQYAESAMHCANGSEIVQEPGNRIGALPDLRGGKNWIIRPKQYFASLPRDIIGDGIDTLSPRSKGCFRR
jgi:hypothetical protein